MARSVFQRLGRPSLSSMSPHHARVLGIEPPTPVGGARFVSTSSMASETRWSGVAPAAIGRPDLSAQQLCPPALCSNAGSLRGPNIFGCFHQIAHDLPANRGIRLEKPR